MSGIRVVCTAGHVDHGKSTLVEALTGTNPDRFAEERRRGLTIDIGFASAALDTGAGEPVTVAFVDLPGHERFVGNMLAGAGAVELALLVVAADEGWMPQTAEHTAILDLLGVRHGLVAVTKTDTVDAETAELAVELTREELAGTSLAGVDVVPVSARTGAGIPQFAERLHAMVIGAPAPIDRGRPRLWVDRAFSVAGAGTVATGTLTGGSIATGDRLAVLPDGPTARARGLQQLGVDVAEALPDTRVAVALAGVEREAVPRGSALGRPDQWRPTALLDARVRTLEDAEIGRRGAWKLHAGSGVRSVKVTPLGGVPVRGHGDVRLALDHPLPLVPGDRFVLRETGRRATLGGGIVLDADPPGRLRGAAARRARRAALDARGAAVDQRDDAALLACHVRERGAVDAARAQATTGVPAGTEPGGLVDLGSALADPASIAAWSTAAVQALGRHHAAHSVERAAPKDVAVRAVTAAGCPPALAGPVLEALTARGDIATEGAGLRLPDHAPRLDDHAAEARTALLERLAREGFEPSRLSIAAQEAGASPSLVRELEAAGELVRLGEDLAVPPATVDAAHAALSEAYANEGALTAARAKEVLGTTRRVALPLLETLDRLGRTRRAGDLRDVLPAPSPRGR